MSTFPSVFIAPTTGEPVEFCVGMTCPPELRNQVEDLPCQVESTVLGLLFSLTAPVLTAADGSSLRPQPDGSYDLRGVPSGATLRVSGAPAAELSGKKADARAGLVAAERRRLASDLTKCRARFEAVVKKMAARGKALGDPRGCTAVPSTTASDGDKQTTVTSDASATTVSRHPPAPASRGTMDPPTFSRTAVEPPPAPASRGTIELESRNPPPDQPTMCQHCRELIPRVNFALHQVQCKRMRTPCPVAGCGAVLDRDAVNAHVAEFHTLVPCARCGVPTTVSEMATHAASVSCVAACSRCGDRVPANELASHDKFLCRAPCSAGCGERVAIAELEEHLEFSCLLRKSLCPFCELSVPFKELDEHQDLCGSRTDCCDTCGTRMQLRYLLEHAASCTGAPPAPPPAPVMPWEAEAEILQRQNAQRGGGGRQMLWDTAMPDASASTFSAPEPDDLARAIQASLNSAARDELRLPAVGAHSSSALFGSAPSDSYASRALHALHQPVDTVRSLDDDTVMSSVEASAEHEDSALKQAIAASMETVDMQALEAMQLEEAIALSTKLAHDAEASNNTNGSMHGGRNPTEPNRDTSRRPLNSASSASSTSSHRLNSQPSGSTLSRVSPNGSSVAAQPPKLQRRQVVARPSSLSGATARAAPASSASSQADSTSRGAGELPRRSAGGTSATSTIGTSAGRGCAWKDPVSGRPCDVLRIAEPPYCHDHMCSAAKCRAAVSEAGSRYCVKHDDDVVEITPSEGVHGRGLGGNTSVLPKPISRTSTRWMSAEKK